jgi:predicted nucleic acid-binding protein
MSYLLDVNALIALLLAEHSHHARTLAWVQDLTRRNEAHLLTCPVTELGFVRIISRAGAYGRTVLEARQLLQKAKLGRTVRFSFVPDDLQVSGWPAWISRSSQVTDGHLLGLATKNRASFATLDEEIPGAFLIPR